MPYKVTYTKAVPSTYRRKTYAKKKIYKARSQGQQQRAFAPTTGGTSVGRTQLQSVPLFPVRKYVKGQLYYEPNIGITTSIGSQGIYNFSANGIYDPNRTGTGHQPLGFDQMMLMYEQFCVIRSHIKVTFLATDEPCRVAIMLSPDTNPAPSISAVMENGLMITTSLIGSSAESGTHRMKTLQLACDIPKYFGKAYQSILADPLQSGTVAADPGEQVYFQIVVWDPYGAQSTSVALDVTISYDVMYWEPKKLASS